MEEMLIIPRAEAPELVQKHSALLMEDGRLSHAARLAARQERLLNDPTLPDDVAVERVKPVDRKLRRAVKKLRQIQTQPLTAEEEAQEGQELLTPALSKWMRRMVRVAKPDGVPLPPPLRPVDATPAEGRRRRILPPSPSETPKRGKTPPSSGKKKKDPIPYTRSLHARGTEGCDLETHPSEKEDLIFDRSASFEIAYHPLIVGLSITITIITKFRNDPPLSPYMTV